MKVSFIDQIARYGRVSENDKVDLWRYSPYNLEGSMGIWVLDTILYGVSILAMFDWRSNFELRPNLSSVRFFFGAGNFIAASNLVHYCSQQANHPIVWQSAPSYGSKYESLDLYKWVHFHSLQIKFDFADTPTWANSRVQWQLSAIHDALQCSMLTITQNTYRPELVSDHLLHCRESNVKCWERNQFGTNMSELCLVKCSMHQLLFAMNQIGRPFGQFEFTCSFHVDRDSQVLVIDPSKDCYTQ
jgi:hypothetical protein